MAEYIDREKVIDMTGLSEWFESSDDYNEFIYELGKLPTADVIEREEYNKLVAEGFLKDCESCESNLRSKIDKVIEEITLYENDCEYAVSDDEKCVECTRNVFKSIYEIIKRNVGE